MTNKEYKVLNYVVEYSVKKALVKSAEKGNIAAQKHMDDRYNKTYDSVFNGMNYIDIVQSAYARVYNDIKDVETLVDMMTTDYDNGIRLYDPLFWSKPYKTIADVARKEATRIVVNTYRNSYEKDDDGNIVPKYPSHFSASGHDWNITIDYVTNNGFSLVNNGHMYTDDIHTKSEFIQMCEYTELYSYVLERLSGQKRRIFQIIASNSLRGIDVTPADIVIDMNIKYDAAQKALKRTKKETIKLIKEYKTK